MELELDLEIMKHVKKIMENKELHDCLINWIAKVNMVSVSKLSQLIEALEQQNVNGKPSDKLSFTTPTTQQPKRVKQLAEKLKLKFGSKTFKAFTFFKNHDEGFNLTEFIDGLEKL